MAGRTVSIRTFTTCPQTKDVGAADYAERVAEVAGWSEAGGCHGILVYPSGGGMADPVARCPADHPEHARFEPARGALQPVYMSPYAAAKMVATLGYLHGSAMPLSVSQDTMAPARFAPARRLRDALGIVRSSNILGLRTRREGADASVLPAMKETILSRRLSQPSGRLDDG